MKYFKLQKAFKLYVLYVVLWMHIFMDLFKVSSSPGKKEEITKEEEEEDREFTDNKYQQKSLSWPLHTSPLSVKY